MNEIGSPQPAVIHDPSGLRIYQLPLGDRTLYWTQTQQNSLSSSQQSASRYGALNVALHVGDDPKVVQANRMRLMDALEPHGVQAIVWLEQVHGVDVASVARDQPLPLGSPVADAAVSTQPAVALASMTADCLPVVLLDQAAQSAQPAIAVAHAGWRGLLAGVIESAAQAMPSPPQAMWLGAAIGPQAFAVGPEVREAFLSAALPAERAETQAAFQPAGARWLADLHALARLRAQRVGAHVMSSSDRSCTASDDRWYSYRRDGQTGRMATLAWWAPTA